MKKINKPIDGDGTTPLMVACGMGADRRIIEILLEAGAELGTKDIFGRTALHWAVICFKINSFLEGIGISFKDESQNSGSILPVKSIIYEIEVNPRDVNGQTPLHFACSSGHLHIVELLLGHNGIDANVLDNDGDTPLHVAVQDCLHLAVEREVFDSEDAPLDLLNECCTALNLKEDEMLSGVVVSGYLASQGADFHHKNNNNNTPLDLIKDPNLRRKLIAFSPPQCLLCRNKAATTKVHPCGHLVICKGCSNVPLQQCLKCLKPVTSRGRVEAPKFEDRCVQTEATCQELGAASQAIESPVLKERDLLRVAKRLGRDWWQIGEYI
ncbi:E3 ubiquitin-protein ligase MIB2 isoform X10 [Octopus vulgaris]|uniref:E3 ubiquitin-protein ligase MIB2 isoform X10 n=1 Tax=Octopus vulgaris TaxID=6645 RepID=A0AA36HIS5_OCTVU|nr:E3 ubiquitin-protein ligase MIB2 isoform X10 [Octopus vulgaris]